jgi:hypothetical protein
MMQTTYARTVRIACPSSPTTPAVTGYRKGTLSSLTNLCWRPFNAAVPINRKKLNARETHVRSRFRGHEKVLTSHRTVKEIVWLTRAAIEPIARADGVGGCDLEGARVGALLRGVDQFFFHPVAFTSSCFASYDHDRRGPIGQRFQVNEQHTAHPRQQPSLLQMSQYCSVFRTSCAGNARRHPAVTAPPDREWWNAPKKDYPQQLC